MEFNLGDILDKAISGYVAVETVKNQGNLTAPTTVEYAEQTGATPTSVSSVSSVSSSSSLFSDKNMQYLLYGSLALLGIGIVLKLAGKG